MRKILIVIMLLLSITLAGCSTRKDDIAWEQDVVEFLDNNKINHNFDDEFDGELIHDNISDADFILLGEIHFKEGFGRVDYIMLKEVLKTTNNIVYLGEFESYMGVLMQEYIDTGDITILTKLAKYAGYSAYTDYYDNYKFLFELRKLSLELGEEYNIKISGISNTNSITRSNAISRANGTAESVVVDNSVYRVDRLLDRVDYIIETFEESGLNFGDNLDSLLEQKVIFEQYINYGYSKGETLDIITSEETHIEMTLIEEYLNLDKTKLALGEDWIDVYLVFKSHINIGEFIYEYAGGIENATTGFFNTRYKFFREEYIYDFIVTIKEIFPDYKMYGKWGAAHISANCNNFYGSEGIPNFVTRLNQNKIFESMLSIELLPVEFEQGWELNTRLPKPLLDTEFDMTIMSLEEEDSDFVETDDFNNAFCAAPYYFDLRNEAGSFGVVDSIQMIILIKEVKSLQTYTHANIIELIQSSPSW